MKIRRDRWIIMRNNRTEILVGLSRSFHFKPVSQIENAAIKTYMSKDKALKSFAASWHNKNFEVEAVKVSETIEIVEKGGVDG